MELYCKKLSSLNPDKYEYIGFEDGVIRYGKYCQTFYKYYGFDAIPKTFNKWLRTEI